MPRPMTPRKPAILVVDDEFLVRMVAADHFEDAGYEVVEAADGASALAVLEQRTDIRAVLTDVQMPGTPDGFVLARRAREICPDCAIVVVSGRQWPSPDDLAEGARFVTKPYKGQAVVSLIDQMIGRTG